MKTLETTPTNTYSHKELNNMMGDFVSSCDPAQEESYEVACEEWSIKDKIKWLTDIGGYELFDDEGNKI